MCLSRLADFVNFDVAAFACSRDSTAVLSKRLYITCGFIDVISCTIWQQDSEVLLCLHYAVTGVITGSLASLAHSISLKALSYPLLPLTAPRSSGKCFSRIFFSCPSAVLLQHCKIVRHNAQLGKAARFGMAPREQHPVKTLSFASECVIGAPTRDSMNWIHLLLTSCLCILCIATGNQ